MVMADSLPSRRRGQNTSMEELGRKEQQDIDCDPIQVSFRERIKQYVTQQGTPC